jgi:hypothetical protein
MCCVYDGLERHNNYEPQQDTNNPIPIPIYYNKRMKPINTLCGSVSELLSITVGSIYSSKVPEQTKRNRKHIVRFQVLTAASMKFIILSYLTLTLYLSLFYYGPPTHLPLAHLLTYRHPFPIGQPSQFGLLYNLLSFRARLTHRPDDGGSTHL